LSRARAASAGALPSAKPTRQPAIENDFVSEYVSTATSAAPGTWRIEGGRWPSNETSA
jgi:hypothetical protein